MNFFHKSQILKEFIKPKRVFSACIFALSEFNFIIIVYSTYICKYETSAVTVRFESNHAIFYIQKQYWYIGVGTGGG